MKALSVLQPWAFLLAAKHQNIGNIAWPMEHRGPLLIHASKSMKLLQGEEGTRLIETLAPQIGMVSDALADSLDYEAVIGRIDVVDCYQVSELALAGQDEKWADGPWCFICRDAVLFKKPIPFQGAYNFLFQAPETEEEST